MGLKSLLSLPLAKRTRRRLEKVHRNPGAAQDRIFKYLVHKAQNTAFGKDHDFVNIKSHADFKERVPVIGYEEISGYINRVLTGEQHVTWPGTPLYMCKTSGTTSGAKYIPISRQSIRHHIAAARDAILCYIEESGNTAVVNGNMIFVQGSPALDTSGKVPVGRLSGIVAHHVPGYLQRNRLPSMTTNMIEDWEKKIDAIVEETIDAPMSLISGIPPWVQMYMEVLLKKSGKSSIKELYPTLQLIVHGGVNYEPYNETFTKLLGGFVPMVETYPSSEGFIAFQDHQDVEGLLLNLEAGIFYEFIPLNEVHHDNPTRLSLTEVEVGVDYAIVLSTTAGLWGYLIGDTVRFISDQPYRLVVSGRIAHFTSAFGEHVIGVEVERAMKHVAETLGLLVKEFHVAPQVSPEEGAVAYHEWFIEFTELPNDITEAARLLDEHLQSQNTYYKDLRHGNMLGPLRITVIQPSGFKNYMDSIGKLGGQNKVPRLANDRKIADALGSHALI